MTRLFGRSLTGGSAIGIAVLARWTRGVPDVPARVAEELALAARRGYADPIDVVLVAEDAVQAASLALPGVRVVGIVGEADTGSDIELPIPVLSSVAQATTRIAENDLVLIDGDRGLILVDPDGLSIAAYQAERERLSPRRRIYIDYDHEVARTLDGRVVRVHGLAASEEEVAASSRAGADSIIISEASSYQEDDEDAEYLRFSKLVRAAAGKSVTVAASPTEVHFHALLRASGISEITLALCTIGETTSPAEVAEYLRECGRELSERDENWRPVRLAISLRLEDEALSEEILMCVHRLIIDLRGTEATMGPAIIEAVMERIEMASAHMIPVEVILPPSEFEALETVASLGASGVAVSSDRVQAAKERIRHLDASETYRALIDRRSGT